MLSSIQKKSLCQMARKSIASELNLPVDKYAVSDDPLFKEKRGAFVTLHKQGRLRGCIGYIEAVKSVRDTIDEMAKSAAFSDPRFPPVTRDEFDYLDIEISILSPITELASIDELEIGKHGLIITKGYNRGLLLPQVATEQGWDKITFLEHTCSKAGLNPDAWKKGAKIEKFSADVFGEKE